LNNPLGVISMYAQMALKRMAEKDPARPLVETIKRNTDVCQRIIQDLLMYARQGPIQRGPMNVNQALSEVVSFCRPLAAKSKVTVGVNLADALPKHEGDANQLQQVFTNLFVNAVQAMKDGGELTVSSSVEREDGRDTAILVRFKDTGVGIPPSDLERIFYPFYTTKPEGEGTGLGLSVSKSIVEAHGGSIRVASEVGKGSEFTVVLPVVRDDERSAASAK